VGVPQIWRAQQQQLGAIPGLLAVRAWHPRTLHHDGNPHWQHTAQDGSWRGTTPLPLLRCCAPRHLTPALPPAPAPAACACPFPPCCFIWRVFVPLHAPSVPHNTHAHTCSPSRTCRSCRTCRRLAASLRSASSGGCPAQARRESRFLQWAAQSWPTATTRCKRACVLCVCVCAGCVRCVLCVCAVCVLCVCAVCVCAVCVCCVCALCVRCVCAVCALCGVCLPGCRAVSVRVASSLCVRAPLTRAQRRALPHATHHPRTGLPPHPTTQGWAAGAGDAPSAAAARAAGRGGHPVGPGCCCCCRCCVWLWRGMVAGFANALCLCSGGHRVPPPLTARVICPHSFAHTRTRGLTSSRRWVEHTKRQQEAEARIMKDVSVMCV
jgi:hypothetical protein